MIIISKPVFMLIVDKDDYNKVIHASECVTQKTNEYIEEERDELVNYTIYVNDRIINFSINKYDSVTAGLQGTYNDFYEYKDEKNTFLLSTNEEKLKGFCGWINRLTH